MASLSMAVSKGLRCPTYFSNRVGQLGGLVVVAHLNMPLWRCDFLSNENMDFIIFYPQNRRFIFCACVFPSINTLVTGSQNKGGYRLGPSKPAQAQHGFRHNTTDLGGNFSQNQLPWVESNHLCRGFNPDFTNQTWEGHGCWWLMLTTLEHW